MIRAIKNLTDRAWEFFLKLFRNQRDFHMTKEEYLKKCGKTKTEDLTDEHILSFFIKGNVGQANRESARAVLSGMFNVKEEYTHFMSLLRIAFEKNRIVKTSLDQSRSDGVRIYSCKRPGFEMTLL